MKILIVGATGTLGRAIAERLAPRHELIAASRNSTDYPVDITSDSSVAALFERTGPIDAIVSAAGALHFGPLASMSTTDFAFGLNDKLLGQVRLALLGQAHVRDGGSITLTSGILSEEVIRNGANATTVNAALEGFVRASATELPRGLRINVVSPTVLTESWDSYGPYFSGYEPVTGAQAALAYQRSVEGVQTGKVFKVW